MKLNHEIITAIRLKNQYITGNKCSSASDLVSSMGALQAQDYSAAKFAIGLRTNKATDYKIEKAIINKEIIRTWPLRNTLHFVSSSDIRWLLAIQDNLKGKYISRRMMQLGFTNKLLTKCRKTTIKSLAGKKELTRAELLNSFEDGGVKLSGIQLSHLLSRLAKEQLICFGSYNQKKTTFTLLDEWIPFCQIPEREEILAEIAKRYFFSRGPATIIDFSWWSGLKISDAKTALKMTTGLLQEFEYDGEKYYASKEIDGKNSSNNTVHLLPWFDEYIVSYRKRSSIINPEVIKLVNPGGGMIHPVLLIKGRVSGLWKREILKDVINIKIDLFFETKREFIKQIEKVVDEYSSFLGKKTGKLVIKFKDYNYY